MRRSMDTRNGIYLVYPTSPIMKSIWKPSKTQVNDQFTKVGQASRGFDQRRRDYTSKRAFGTEVVFKPIVEVPLERLDMVEARVLDEMNKRYEAVIGGHGRPIEWYIGRQVGRADAQ
jgi:hypothetical protein